MLGRITVLLTDQIQKLYDLHCFLNVDVLGKFNTFFFTSHYLKRIVLVQYSEVLLKCHVAFCKIQAWSGIIAEYQAINIKVVEIVPSNRYLLISFKG